MIFPNPLRKEEICNEEKLLVFTECYCPNGHSLISENVFFNGFKGILLKISKDDESGQVALSPVYGCKNRIAIDIDLKEGELYTFSCSECGEILPTYSKCHCGGDIFTLFLNREGNFNSFVGACNRIGCNNAYIQVGKKLITSVRLDSY